jgi:outer membrane protein assembly factor BamD (BamD/ComL family)
MLLFLQGCGTLLQKDKALKEYQLDVEQYQPYKLKNTIDSYREFIARYPANRFVQEAQSQIENLEFAPYERADSVEGYMEFKIRYPNNRHTYKASVKIEQTEVKRYEKMDTIEGYREFLEKYPASTFAVLAKKRVQELEFRELDRTLGNNYGFDLLRYRLNLKRLKKNLATGDHSNLGDFTCFASLTAYEGKKYFQTSLIYPTDLSSLDTTAPDTHERFFDPILSKALAYLDSHFMKKNEIDGFSFDISSSAHSYYKDRKILLAYYFPLSQVNHFVHNNLTKKDLFAQSKILSPKKTLTETIPVASARAPAKEEQLPVEALDGLKIMTRVSERERGSDYIISRSWVRGRHTMKAIEKRKNLSGEGDIIDKSVLRYIGPPDYYGTSVLTWNFKNREKAFWYKSFHSDSTRIVDTESIRPPAEFDFSFEDYIEINVSEERHELIKRYDMGRE